MIASANRSDRITRERGFTLLEVLISLALSMVLMAAVYGSLRLYWQLQSAGRAQVERAQLTRSILSRMTADVSSVVFQAPESSGSEDEQSGTVTVSDDTESTDVEDASSAIVATSSGIVGDAQSLVLHVNRPSRDLAYSGVLDATSVSVSTSDLQTVTYFLSASGSSGLAGATASSMRLDPATGDPVPVSSGLVRLEADRLAVDFADVNADVESLGGTARILAPEVTSLQFQYFDAATQSWTTSWDSSVTGTLPTAIEVTLGMTSSAEAAEADQSFNARPQSYYEHRFVIAVPLSDPYAMSSSF